MAKQGKQLKPIDAEVISENIIAPARGKILQTLDGDNRFLSRLELSFNLAVQKEPKLAECTPESIRRELMKCAFDRLLLDGKEAVMLPYWNGKEKALEANYQPMIYGIQKRMQELGGITKLPVYLVYSNDEFSVEKTDGEERVIHKFSPFDAERGEVVGIYCEVYKDGELSFREFMPKSELDKVKAQSAKQMNDKTSPAWAIWEEEMFKKAVVRRASKRVILDTGLTELIERFDSMFDYDDRPAAKKRGNPFVSEPAKQIDAHPEEATEQEDPSPKGADKQDVGDRGSGPGITPETLQAYSDALYNPDNKDAEAVEKASKSFGDANGFDSSSISDDVWGKIEKIYSIHMDRIKAKDAMQGDMAAAENLAEIGITVSDSDD